MVLTNHAIIIIYSFLTPFKNILLAFFVGFYNWLSEPFISRRTKLSTDENINFLNSVFQRIFKILFWFLNFLLTLKELVHVLPVSMIKLEETLSKE